MKKQESKKTVIKIKRNEKGIHIQNDHGKEWNFFGVYEWQSALAILCSNTISDNFYRTDRLFDSFEIEMTIKA